jgi:imidazoleglycerol-phosphate dehydratase
VISLVTSAIINRKARIERSTKETHVVVNLDIDGMGKTVVKTGFSFIDHLVTAIGKHSMMNINLAAFSKDGIIHHLVEDVSIALSQTIDMALLDRSHIIRFGYATVPMDESLAYVAIDLVKRQFYNIQLRLTRDDVEKIPREDLEHFVKSLLQNLNACTHVIVEYGDNDHHKIESAIKAFAIAFRMAASIDKRRRGVPSTKGLM